MANKREEQLKEILRILQRLANNPNGWNRECRNCLRLNAIRSI